MSILQFIYSNISKDQESGPEDEDDRSIRRVTSEKCNEAEPQQ